MPQFDVFLFFSSIFYLLVGFFSLMFYNQFVFLPKISAILKLREKLLNLSNFDKKQTLESNLKIIKISKTLTN
ncbi:MAG: hypothetical protein EOP33_06520 [Rickettsiaceae bacterium]|nr:MAG: hypothetical protein EOP33_06520 [Rickettsiaceae bacterium]